eukprot:TRINITY_DN3155_c1_g1_i1.p1 TRINITY_DN3155_c1_g1~~TRINITY_DN3155_c1_g1_i1.p1  ORF type:complete len:435 (+),score=69.15 TRINITY_DN3155_c1_g1_i1:49-1305(+)
MGSDDDFGVASSISGCGYPWEEGLRKDPAIVRQFERVLKQGRSTRRGVATEQIVLKKSPKVVGGFLADTCASVARKMSSGKAISTSPQHVKSNSSCEGFSEGEYDPGNGYTSEDGSPTHHLDESRNEPPEPQLSPPEPTGTAASSPDHIKDDRIPSLWKQTVATLRDTRETAKKSLPATSWDSIVTLYESHIESLFECFRLIHEDDQKVISTLTQATKKVTPPQYNKQESQLIVKERRIKHLELRLTASNKRFEGVSDLLQNYQQKARFSALNERRAMEAHRALESAVAQLKALEEDKSDLHKLIRASEARISSLEQNARNAKKKTPDLRTEHVPTNTKHSKPSDNRYTKDRQGSSYQQPHRQIRSQSQGARNSSATALPNDVVASLVSTLKGLQKQVNRLESQAAETDGSHRRAKPK